MSASFSPSTLDERARRLERRRASIEHLAATSRRDPASVLEDLGASDLLDSDASDAHPPSTLALVARLVASHPGVGLTVHAPTSAPTASTAV